MTSDRLNSWLCASAIGLCLVAAAAGIYVLATDPTRDLQPQPQKERAVLIGRERSAQLPHLPCESRRLDVVNVAAVVPESACSGEGFADEVVHAKNFGRVATFNDIQFYGVAL